NEESRWEEGLHLAVSLSRFWASRGHYREGRERIEELLGKGVNAPPLLRAKALNGMAFIAFTQEDPAAIDRLCAESLRISREIGDVYNSAFALSLLAASSSLIGASEPARSLAEEAVDLALRCDPGWLTCFALHFRGCALLNAGETEAAVSDFTKSLALA